MVQQLHRTKNKNKRFHCFFWQMFLFVVFFFQEKHTQREFNYLITVTAMKIIWIEISKKRFATNESNVIIIIFLLMR